MSGDSGQFEIRILPRASITWEEFLATAPRNSIALDGVVTCGPRCDDATNRINFDHHNGVVRDATMSTSKQVYFAIKGGLMERAKPGTKWTIFINDTDQDTTLAVWLLMNYKLFQGVQSIPHVSRLLDITDKLDITGGAFPMNLSEQIVGQHNWVFRPYADMRKSGELAHATAEGLYCNLMAVLGRLDDFLMNRSGEAELDTRHTILYDSPHFKIIDEIGGNEARYLLFSQGLTAFISLVARRSDGRFVYTVGKASQHVRFPVEALYDEFNALEGRDRHNG